VVPDKGQKAANITSKKSIWRAVDPAGHGRRAGQAGQVRRQVYQGPARAARGKRAAAAGPGRFCQSGVLAQPVQRLTQNRGAVGVGAPLFHVRQVRLIRLILRGPGRIVLVASGRVPAAGAIPGLGHRGITRETGPGLVLIRAPEGDPDPGRGLTTFRFAHRAGAYPASSDRVATTHSSPLATSALGPPGDPRAPASVVQQQIQPDDAQEPDDTSENREAVQIPLNYGR